MNHHKILPASLLDIDPQQMNTLLLKNKKIKANYSTADGEQNQIGIYARKYCPGKKAKEAMNLTDGDQNR